jgi:hypothetical protein
MAYRENKLQSEFELRAENDAWYRLIRLRINPEASEGRHEIVLRSSVEGEPRTRSVAFWVIPPSYIRQYVRLSRFTVPSDNRGNPDLKREQNALSTKETGNRFLRSISMGTQSGSFENAAAEFENTGDYPVTLNVRYAILNHKSLAPVDWLVQHEDETGVNEPILSTTVLLKPHSRGTAIFRISGGDKGMIPGEYIQRLSAGLLAARKEFISKEFPLRIREIDIHAAALAMLAVCIALVGIAGIIVFRKQILGGFTSREYILIGLYAAVAFSLVSVPSTIAYNILHALMGPFSFLVTGIFSEVIYYLLLLSLAMLIPRPGVMFFFVFTLLLMNGVILGNFTATSVILYPAQAIILELAFFLSGLYEKDPSARFGLSKNCGFAKILWAAFIFGIADAFFSYITFNLSIFVYRLYYAEWYILGYVFISGFLYTLISAPLGIKLGARLRTVALD